MKRKDFKSKETQHPVRRRTSMGNVHRLRKGPLVQICNNKSVTILVLCFKAHDIISLVLHSNFKRRKKQSFIFTLSECFVHSDYYLSIFILSISYRLLNRLVDIVRSLFLTKYLGLNLRFVFELHIETSIHLNLNKLIHFMWCKWGLL